MFDARARGITTVRVEFGLHASSFFAEIFVFIGF